MLDLLIAAQTVSERTDAVSSPDSILTFALDYYSPPDLEVERTKIIDLLGGNGFDLSPFGEDDPNILILSFSGAFREQSPAFLFETAQELTDALGLRQVDPDIGAPWRDTLSVPSITEGVIGDIAWALCQSGNPTPVDPRWAPNLIKALDVHTTGITGAGITIGQPDTGATDHVELDPGVDIGAGFDFLAGTQGGRDPLSKDMGSPGHGTGTSSVAVSRSADVIVGSAPGADLIPLRCVNSVVIGFGARVAKAIDYGRKKGCDVITMSLGGPFVGFALRRAIDRAVSSNMIVLAASGNCVKKVVQPASLNDVIAVAAVNERCVPWPGSCRGKTVDISAPGENVSVAQRAATEAGDPVDPDAERRINHRGQGTSFAVALTAGVAALWLERHTPAAIKTEAQRRVTTVQELFRSALKQTAGVPSDWDSTEMGAGVVNAQELLALPLDQIVLGADGPSTVGDFFDLSGLSDRFRSEAEFLDFDWSLRSQPELAGALESAMTPRPSPHLVDALQDVAVPKLQAPANIVTPKTPPADLSEALRKLGASRSNNLESATTLSETEARTRLGQPGAIDEVMEMVNSDLVARQSLSQSVNADVQKEAMYYMHQALRIEVGGSSTDETHSTGHRASLEALVRLTGRPSIRIPKDTDELMSLQLGQWSSFLKPTETRWRKLTNAIGRIDHRFQAGESWGHVGTGFVIGPGLILTNRHVLDALAEPLPTLSGPQKFKPIGEASIIFDNDATDESTRHKVTGIVTAGRFRIGKFVDLSKVDAAVLQIEVNNGTSEHPTAVPRADIDTISGDLPEILVSGYPGRPGAGSEPIDSSQIGAFWTRIGEIFGDEYGVKYMSPGLVVDRPGTLPGDSSARVFSHDATTLGGFSGSGILPLTRGGYLGLHFGGATLSMNMAHDIAALIDSSDQTFDVSVF